MHDNDPEVRLLATIHPDPLQNLLTADSGTRKTKKFDRYPAQNFHPT